MSLQGTPIKEDGLHHDHYTYVMSFDSIGKWNSRTKCSLCEQTKLQQNQLHEDYWKQTDSQYLAYSGETHCTYVDTIKATNQASCAPAQRTFSMLEVPSLSYIDLKYDEFCRFIENEVQDFFNQKMTMLSRVVEVLTSVKRAAINAANTNSENFVQHMNLLVSYVDTKLHSFNEGSMVLNKEVQFKDWIFNYIHPVLVKKGFTVETDIVNKDIIPNVNEYSTSKPDCLIYHEGSIC